LSQRRDSVLGARRAPGDEKLENDDAQSSLSIVSVCHQRLS
jgi:hypothetical protein